MRLVVVDASWGRRYRETAAELEGALGDAMRNPGGRLLEVHHVGSTAVPGLLAKPTLDLMARLASWPLDDRARIALAGLGYVDHGEHGLPGRRFATRGGHDVHLHLLAPDSGRLRPHLAFRDLLLEDEVARERYGALKRRLVAAHGGTRRAYVGGKDEEVRRLSEAATRRAPARTGFVPVADLARRVAASGLGSGLDAGHDDGGTALGVDPGAHGGWAIGGGWALDLTIGRVTRAHDDVDVVLARDGADAWMAAVAARGVTFRAAHRSGGGPWRPGDPLPSDPPRLDARAGPAVASSPAWEPNGVAPIFWDVVVEPRPAGAWILRTDPEVTLPVARAIVRRALPGATPAHGVPALAPEVVLACKARLSGRGAEEGKDLADLEAVLPFLDAGARAWLRAALARPPAHPWRARLAGRGPMHGDRCS